MWRRFKKMPSGPTAIAFTALLVALSGTAVALPGKNSVDSGDIRNNNVKSADIGRGQVKAADVGANAVSGAKVGDNSLTGVDINESSLGQVPSANSANTANSASTATNANTVNGKSSSDIVSEAKPLRAAVGEDCTPLRRGTGAVSVNLDFPARCDVRFNRNVQSCVPIVGLADSNGGELSAALINDVPGAASLDPDEVGVIYRDSAGALDSAAPRPPFNVTVEC